MNKKFYEFKNQSETSTDLYVYGEITSDKSESWWPVESDVDLNDFKEALNECALNSTLNIFVNSPGGSVFAASTMCSMLQRAKATKGLKIVAYIDGLAASAASFLIMVADEINLYKNSMLMVHKPLSIVYGNADDMQKEIEVLNSIENNVMLPLYMKKARCEENTLKDLINAESWLSAEEVDNLFYVNLIDEEKNSTDKIDTNLFKNYKNVPNQFKNNEVNEQKTLKLEKNEEEPKQQKVVEENQDIDYSYFEEKLGRR